MTAHTRLAPDTGDLYFFGYEAGGLVTKDVVVLRRRQEGQPDARRVVRSALRRADARFRRHARARHLPGVSHHGRSESHEGRRPPLGVRAGQGIVRRHPSARRSREAHALVPRSRAIVVPFHERLQRRQSRSHVFWRQQSAAVPVHAAGVGDQSAARSGAHRIRALDLRSIQARRHLGRDRHRPQRRHAAHRAQRSDDRFRHRLLPDLRSEKWAAARSQDRSARASTLSSGWK